MMNGDNKIKCEYFDCARVYTYSSEKSTGENAR